MTTGSIATRPEFIPTSSTLLSISDLVHFDAALCTVPTAKIATPSGYAKYLGDYKTLVKVLTFM
jgi:hypothetical protein